MLLPDGSRLGAVDALTELWTGKPPANRCPAIDSLEARRRRPGRARRDGPRPARRRPTRRATRSRSAGCSSATRSAYGAGGDAEEVPPTFPDAIVKADADTGPRCRCRRTAAATGCSPTSATATAARRSANVPLLVKGPAAAAGAKAATLPLVVYDEAGRETAALRPAGWMGNTKAIKLDPTCADDPHAGKTCMRIDYRRPTAGAASSGRTRPTTGATSRAAGT